MQTSVYITWFFFPLSLFFFIILCWSPTSKWKAQSRFLLTPMISALSPRTIKVYPLELQIGHLWCTRLLQPFYFFFNRASNALDDSAVNSGLTLQPSGFIICMFGSGISSYCRYWDYLCLQGASPKSPAVIWPGYVCLRSECILVWSLSWLPLIVAISDLTLLGTQIDMIKINEASFQSWTFSRINL